MSHAEELIVAEVSKTWHIDLEAKPPLLSQQFEEVIKVNSSRGYVLESWHMTSTLSGDGKSITETIVAVFRLVFIREAKK